MRELSIYIHIPFCVRKCLYCDFLSFAVSECDRPERMMMSYVNLLKHELVMQATNYRNHRVVSVFWGGGTPSLLPEETVGSIMNILRQYYHVSADAEITVEANPGTVTQDKLHGYITAGINRLSIGLQSTYDAELARIGRIHDYRTFLETYRLAREAGFRNINIDLMSALPGQSVPAYRETLRRVAVLAPEHISAYSLILEEGTPLYERQQEYQFPSEEEDREMYLLTNSYLSSCGYHRYEISNYAREGYECRHNKVYWKRGDYVGFGLGAASMVDNIRWSNPADLEQYRAYIDSMDQVGGRLFGRLPGPEQESYPEEDFFVPERQVLTKKEQMEEFMFLGLRMVCGVSCKKFADLFGQEIEEVYGGILNTMYDKKLLARDTDHIRLTTLGIDVSNYVMAEFLFDS